ncbi:MAG: Maf family protein [Oscillospiraceae bacterium]
MKIILASQSPRRRELFSLITRDFECAVAPVDERSVSSADAEDLCVALARLKCAAVAANMPQNAVVGCDTAVQIESRILGKPRSKDEAREMISLLSGKTHSVYTGVCIGHLQNFNSFFCRTDVSLFRIPTEAIEEYISTPEPYDKAGAYGIQGWMAKYIDRLDGDYFNVMGLPLSRVYAALKGEKFV